MFAPRFCLELKLPESGFMLPTLYHLRKTVCFRNQSTCVGLPLQVFMPKIIKLWAILATSQSHLLDSVTAKVERQICSLKTLTSSAAAASSRPHFEAIRVQIELLDERLRRHFGQTLKNVSQTLFSVFFIILIVHKWTFRVSSMFHFQYKTH